MESILDSKDNELLRAVECNDLNLVKNAIVNHQITISEECAEKAMARAIIRGKVELIKLLIPIQGWKQYSLHDALEQLTDKPSAVVLFEQLKDSSCRRCIYGIAARLGLESIQYPNDDYFLATHVAFRAGSGGHWNIINGLGALYFQSGFNGAVTRDQVGVIEAILKTQKVEAVDPEVLLESELIENDASKIFNLLLNRVSKTDKRKLIDVLTRAFSRALSNGSGNIYGILKSNGLMISKQLDWRELLPIAIQKNHLNLAKDLVLTLNVPIQEIQALRKSMSREMEAVLILKQMTV